MLFESRSFPYNALFQALCGVTVSLESKGKYMCINSIIIIWVYNLTVSFRGCSCLLYLCFKRRYIFDSVAFGLAAFSITLGVSIVQAISETCLDHDFEALSCIDIFR